MTRLCEHRGGILLFILPLLLVRLGLHHFFPYEHDWADFFFLLCFFILGYLLFADKRFTQAVQRDWLIMLTVGIAVFLALVALTFATGELDVNAAARTLSGFIWWGLVTVCSSCWTAFMVFVGIRFLNFTNKWLQYGKEALLPFCVVHQPVIIVIAYFAVQWNAAILIKMLAVVLGSFVVTVGIYELVIRRIDVLHALFGLKSAQGVRQDLAGNKLLPQS